jgi:hypothetical protein
MKIISDDGDIEVTIHVVEIYTGCQLFEYSNKVCGTAHNFI